MLKSSRNKIIAIIIVIAILIAAFISSRPQTTQVKYITNPVTTNNITVSVSVSGSITANNIVYENFKTAGQITEIDVKPGDNVVSGQLLSKIDSTALQTQLNSDQSALNIANNNQGNLYKKGNYTYYDYLNAKEAINQAQNKVNMDNTNLSNANLTSSIAGVVASVNNYVGDSVSGSGNNSNPNASTIAQSSAFIVIVDTNSYLANLTIGESDISNIKVGQPVQLSIDALGTKKFVGKVLSIDTLGTIASNVVSYNVKVSFDKLDPIIKLGMSVNATILIQTKTDVLTVPNSAIKSVGGSTIVQLLKNNTPQTIQVTTGITDGSNTEIIDGLTKGDQVIISTINTGSGATSSNGFSLGGGGRSGARLGGG